MSGGDKEWKGSCFILQYMVSFRGLDIELEFLCVCVSGYTQYFFFLSYFIYIYIYSLEVEKQKIHIDAYSILEANITDDTKHYSAKLIWI